VNQASDTAAAAAAARALGVAVVRMTSAVEDLRVLQGSVRWQSATLLRLVVMLIVWPGATSCALFTMLLLLPLPLLNKRHYGAC
jgi:hypothetical protein